MKKAELLADNRGAALVVALTVIVISVLITVPVLIQTVNERQISSKWGDATRAFYAADSGLSFTIWCMNNYSDAAEWTTNGWANGAVAGDYILPIMGLTDINNNIVSYFEVGITDTVGVAPALDVIGYAPTTAGTSRIVRATLESSPYAITARGDIDIGGNAEIDGEMDEYADFSFDGVFGEDVATMKARADTEVVVDPANNYGPVPRPAETYIDNAPANGQYDEGEAFTDSNGSGSWDDEMRTTWFEVPEGGKAKITNAGWSGSGILVVEGDIEVNGGTFTGVLYVIGNLSIAGNDGLEGYDIRGWQCRRHDHCNRYGRYFV